MQCDFASLQLAHITHFLQFHWTSIRMECQKNYRTAVYLLNGALLAEFAVRNFPLK
jgi:hypothetical protein